MQQNKETLFGRDYFERNSQGIGYNDKSAFLFAKITAKAIKESIAPESSVDIGCAKGYLVDFLYQSGIDAQGLDISHYAISQSSERIKGRLKIIDAEKEPLPYPQEHAGLITVLEVLEHLRSLGLIAAEIKRVLKKGGYLLINTPTPWGRFAKIDPTHVNVRPPRFWRELFYKEGFIPAEKTIKAAFKDTFLKEFRGSMPENPPTTGLSAALEKLGAPGKALRATLPYIDYFSFLRSDEVILLRKPL